MFHVDAFVEKRVQARVVVFNLCKSVDFCKGLCEVSAGVRGKEIPTISAVLSLPIAEVAGRYSIPSTPGPFSAVPRPIVARNCLSQTKIFLEIYKTPQDP